MLRTNFQMISGISKWLGGHKVCIEFYGKLIGTLFPIEATQISGSEHCQVVHKISGLGGSKNAIF